MAGPSDDSNPPHSKLSGPELPAAYQFRTLVISSFCLTICWLGDAVIYVVLPLYAATFGFNIVEIGALFIVNRIVRVVGYGWVSPAARYFGTNVLTAVATGAGALTTIVYGLTTNFFLFFLARMVWGASWGVLNLITTAYAYGEGGEGAGKRVGLARALGLLGPLFACLFVGYLCVELGPQQMFIIYGLIGLIGVPVAFLLPSIPYSKVEGAPPERRLIPTPLNILVFFISFGADGILGTTFSLILAKFMPVSSAIIGAGMLIAFQRGINIVLALTSGPVVDRIGPLRLVIPTCLGITVGLLLVASEVVYIGVVTVIICRALLATATPLLAAQRSKDRIAALASYGTWNDVGLAFGSFFGAISIATFGASLTYSTFAVLIAATAVIYVRTVRNKPTPV